MKKKNYIVYSILLFILFVFLIGSFGIQICVIKTVSDIYTEEHIQGSVLQELLYNYDTNQQTEILNNVKHSKYIDRITQKCLNVIIFNVTNDCYKNLHIDKELNGIIENNLAGVEEKEKKFIASSFEREDYQGIIDRVTDALNSGWKNEKIIVIIYAIYTNTIYRIFNILLIALIIYKLYRESEQKYKAIGNVGIALFSSSVILFVITYIIKIFKRNISSMLLGGTMDFSVRYMHNMRSYWSYIYNIGFNYEASSKEKRKRIKRKYIKI